MTRRSKMMDLARRNTKDGIVFEFIIFQVYLVIALAFLDPDDGKIVVAVRNGILFPAIFSYPLNAVNLKGHTAGRFAEFKRGSG